MTKKPAKRQPTRKDAHHLPELPRAPEAKPTSAPPVHSLDARHAHVHPAHHHGHIHMHAAAQTAPAKASPLPADPVHKRGMLEGMKSLFRRKKAAPKDSAQAAAAAPPVKTPEAQADELLKKGEKARAPKKERRRLKRKSLQEYLDKAGYEVPAAKVKKVMFRVLLVSFLITTTAVLAIASREGAEALDTLVFLAGLWTAVFALATLVALGAVYFFLDYRIYRRTREVEDVLPDFLQLASANIAAGMPIDRALWYSIRPSFGVLAKEMEEVAKATMAGEDLEASLVHFTDKYDSVLLKRSISILIEGLRSGGELADLLNKIALNIDEIKIMKKEMAANVTTYAIFIIAAAVAIAPALFALATQLLSIIVRITGSLDLSATSSMFSLGAVDPAIVGNFTMFCYVMLVVSSTFGACIVSVIKNGNVLEGIKAVPVYALVALVIYKISLIALGVMFGSLI